MAAVSSESVDTMTASNTPLSMAGAIVYASIGWPCSRRTFLPGTRLEPWRAGIRATADGIALHLTGVVVDVHRLQIRVDVERLRARLAPPVARLAQAAERHVRLAAVGPPVDNGDARLDAADERHRAMNVLRVNRRGEAERRVVRQRHRLVEALHPVEARNRPEQLAARDLVVRPDVFDDGRRDKVPRAVCGSREPLAAGEHRGARLLRPRDRREHAAHLLFVDDRPVVVRVAATDLQRSRRLDEHRLEPFVDRIEDDDAAARGAPLAGVAERRAERPRHRVRQVRIVTDDERVLAAELEAHLGQSPAGRLRNPAPDLARAG